MKNRMTERVRHSIFHHPFSASRAQKRIPSVATIEWLAIVTAAPGLTTSKS
jgi:hypothetical protein